MSPLKRFLVTVGEMNGYTVELRAPDPDAAERIAEFLWRERDSIPAFNLLSTEAEVHAVEEVVS